MRTSIANRLKFLWMELRSMYIIYPRSVEAITVWRKSGNVGQTSGNGSRAISFNERACPNLPLSPTQSLSPQSIHCLLSQLIRCFACVVSAFDIDRSEVSQLLAIWGFVQSHVRSLPLEVTTSLLHRPRSTLDRHNASVILQRSMPLLFDSKDSRGYFSKLSDPYYGRRR